MPGLLMFKLWLLSYCTLCSFLIVCVVNFVI